MVPHISFNFNVHLNLFSIVIVSLDHLINSSKSWFQLALTLSSKELSFANHSFTCFILFYFFWLQQKLKGKSLFRQRMISSQIFRSRQTWKNKKGERWVNTSARLLLTKKRIKLKMNENSLEGFSFTLSLSVPLFCIA